MQDFADVVKPEQQVYSIATKIHVKETIYIHVDALTVEFKLLIEFVVVSRGGNVFTVWVIHYEKIC
jgi:hypothetical protein